jgi:catalase
MIQASRASAENGLQLMVPEQSVRLGAEAAAKKAPDFLIEELQRRLKTGPVTFHLKA